MVFDPDKQPRPISIPELLRLVNEDGVDCAQPKADGFNSTVKLRGDGTLDIVSKGGGDVDEQIKFTEVIEHFQKEELPRFKEYMKKDAKYFFEQCVLYQGGKLTKPITYLPPLFFGNTEGMQCTSYLIGSTDVKALNDSHFPNLPYLNFEEMKHALMTEEGVVVSTHDPRDSDIEGNYKCKMDKFNLLIGAVLGGDYDDELQIYTSFHIGVPGQSPSAPTAKLSPGSDDWYRIIKCDFSQLIQKENGGFKKESKGIYRSQIRGGTVSGQNFIVRSLNSLNRVMRENAKGMATKGEGKTVIVSGKTYHCVDLKPDRHFLAKPVVGIFGHNLGGFKNVDQVSQMIVQNAIDCFSDKSAQDAAMLLHIQSPQLLAIQYKDHSIEKYNEKHIDFIIFNATDEEGTQIMDLWGYLEDNIPDIRNHLIACQAVTTRHENRDMHYKLLFPCGEMPSWDDIEGFGSDDAYNRVLDAMKEKSYLGAHFRSTKRSSHPNKAESVPKKQELVVERVESEKEIPRPTQMELRALESKIVDLKQAASDWFILERMCLNKPNTFGPQAVINRRTEFLKQFNLAEALLDSLKATFPGISVDTAEDKVKELRSRLPKEDYDPNQVVMKKKDRPKLRPTGR